VSDKPVYWLDVDDLLTIFSNYNSRDALYKAVQRGTFPCPTFRLGTKIYADREVVKAYFKRLRDEGLRELESE